MKKNPVMPKGIAPSPSFSLKLSRSDTGTASIPAIMYASLIRHRADRVLDLPGTHNRLTLILGLMIALGLGMAPPMILDCLRLLAELLPFVQENANVVWPYVLYGILFVGTLVFFTLPFLVGVYRMAVLMTEEHRFFEKGEQHRLIGLEECIYPFTSVIAYGRTLYVGVLTLGRIVLALLPPAGILALAFWWIPPVAGSVPKIIYMLLWVLHIAVAMLSLGGMVWFLARGAGFGYFVFAHPLVSLRELWKDFRRYPRTSSLPLWMALGFLGWIAISVVAVLIPLLLHTVPHMLLSVASYGRYLSDNCSRSVEKEGNIDDHKDGASTLPTDSLTEEVKFHET